jgi:hypothetical protein
MRRYQENLVIIGGAQPGRRWTEPVALIDVIRGAVSEVADYQRITVDGDERLFLAAHAVADVIHLLAELIAVALRPSPFGGVSAVVVIPAHLLHQDAPPQTPTSQERTPVAAVTGGPPAAQPAPSWSAFTPARPAVEAPDAPPGAGPRPIEPPTLPQPGSGAPPLPQRVPQASLAEELRDDPPPADALPDGSEPLPPAEVLSRSMSAFQRGTAQARGFGGSTRSPHAPALPEDPR